MKIVIILFLLISFCGGSPESTSTQPQQDQELSQDDVSKKSSKESKETDSNEQSNSSSSQESENPVSYTHLTLPTTSSV